MSDIAKIYSSYITYLQEAYDKHGAWTTQCYLDAWDLLKKAEEKYLDISGNDLAKILGKAEKSAADIIENQKQRKATYEAWNPFRKMKEKEETKQ
jgi:hypothetical protein